MTNKPLPGQSTNGFLPGETEKEWLDRLQAKRGVVEGESIEERVTRVMLAKGWSPEEIRKGTLDENRIKMLYVSPEAFRASQVRQKKEDARDD